VIPPKSPSARHRQIASQAWTGNNHANSSSPATTGFPSKAGREFCVGWSRKLHLTPKWARGDAMAEYELADYGDKPRFVTPSRTLKCAFVGET
jgi:hypothetical protein